MLTRFVRGRERPRGVVWFGARSFWGHLRHFVAAAIATEDVDSRDWMTADDPRELASRIIDILGGDTSASNVVAGVGRDLYIDFVADTGDDVAVSRAVARLVFAEYELPDPDREGAHLVTPRGDILLFGGDTAYPVATAQEITNRVIAPWNQVLESIPPDHKPRVLLGIPGNHDWYDGLDGFGRMFRRRVQDDDDIRPSVVGISQMMLEHYAEWAREFVRGGKVEKPKALLLAGYTPVQNASYFALPLVKGLHVLGVDRQLTTTDTRQTDFLREYYRDHPGDASLVLLPDPIYRFGAPSRSGTRMIENLRLDLAARDTFVLTGDIHHYQRTTRGKLLHVIAGGGGAFLHPARVSKGGLPHRVAWPDSKQSRRLLRGVPIKIARGRSGFLPHLCLLAMFAPAVWFGLRFYDKAGVVIAAPVSMTLFIGAVYALIGGVQRRKSVLPFAFIAALLTAMLPLASSFMLRFVLSRMGYSAPTLWIGVFTLVMTAFAGAFIFGAYLALLTFLGFEHTQAFTALDHPGFKHFVRLRVRADGSGIDGWCVGLADPLGKDNNPVLVDSFSFRPFAES